MRLWVNPPSPLPLALPADIDVTTAHVTVFSGVFWQTEQAQTVDEISINSGGGTWTPLANQFSCGTPDEAMLLTDGTVMVQGLGTGNWCRLSPDQFGSYINGTWSTLASLPAGYAPWLVGSAVLPDGRVIIEGGEYNYGTGMTYCTSAYANRTNCGAIYDPVADSWTEVPPPDFGDECGANGTGWCTIGGAPSVVLPDGSFMIGATGKFGKNQQKPPSRLQAILPPPYDPNVQPWVQTGFGKNDANDEEGWTLLPNLFGASPNGLSPVLTVDSYTSGKSDCVGTNSSEIYLRGNVYGQSAGYWYCLGDTPDQLNITWANEMGPSILRPDGTVFAAGATQYTAILGTNYTWSRGPGFPTDHGGSQLVMNDGPAALLPNGNVVMMASPGQGTIPAVFLELTPDPQNTLVEVPGVSFAGSLTSNSGQMLVLPTGQLLFVPHFGLGSGYLQIYTPANQKVDPSWRPRVAAINGKTCGSSFCTYPVHNKSVNTIDGFGFNGMSQASAFGDEFQSATNYPLVRLTGPQLLCPWPGPCTPPHVYYCRTHDHTYMGVATGNLPVSTKFDCPEVPNGRYNLEVVANGISGSPPGYFTLANVAVGP
jgi:hypothetical protein